MKGTSLILIISLLAVLAITQLLFSQKLPTNHARLETSCEDCRRQQGGMFTSTATRCPVIPLRTLKPHLKSQDKEDQRLLGWFNGLCNGTYIEMGGLDGELFSNTFVFNRALQWQGLLVEASPSNYQKLVQNRPNELATVHAAVCDKRRMVHYYDHPTRLAVRGIWEFAPESFRQRWWKNVTIEQTTPVECSPLRDILEQHVPNQHYFDFFSLDIEGAEFLALQSLDFDQVGFGIILIEADKHNQLKNLAVSTFMESKGYRFMDSYARSYWFVNKEFGTIYKDLSQ
jgi:FkbM family methyltransferase